MGVKLQGIIVREKLDFQRVTGKIVAIDAPNIIMGLFNYILKSKEKESVKLILDRTQRPISHLYGLLYRINFYYSKKIFPLFVFDGKDSDLKRVITKDQLKDFLFTEKWYQETIRSGNKRLAREIALSKEYMWLNIIQESKQLLGALGVPYIESPSSAESQCAYLVKKNIVQYSNSQDFDSLLFGCPHVLQNLSKSMRRKVQGKWKHNRIEPYLIDLQQNLDNLGITIFQLVEMAILIGTDYFPGVKGIGPKKALDLIRRHIILEKVIQNEKFNYEFENLTPEIIRRVRKIFLFPEVNEELENIFWSLPNKHRVLSLLCEYHNLNIERVTKNLDKFFINYQRCREFYMNLKKHPRKDQLTLDLFS
jgi:flap endonuclease-1